MSSEDPSTHVADKRRVDREALDAPVRMRIKTDFISGVSDNISSVGLLFFTDEPLHVELEVENEHGIRTFSGRLVRVQRMNETNTGIAIEFEE